MEKITKKVLKSVVKECLIEILSEGVFPEESTDGRSKSRKLKEAIKLDSGRNKRRKSSDQNIEREEIESSRIKERKKAIVEAARNITDDPILKEVLADTAQTTLQSQLSADSNSPNVLRSLSGVRGADQAAQIVESADPSELFGEEASGKWAKLAFSS